MKTQLLHILQWLVTATISLLGFSACSDDSGEICMYGTPTWDFQANGRITDTEDNPIQGIRIEAITGYDQNGEQIGATLYSDKDGKFSTPIFEKKEMIFLRATDIDGEKNGGDFETKEINIKNLKYDLDDTNQDGWYSGVRTYNDIKIEMTEKSSDEE